MCSDLLMYSFWSTKLSISAYLAIFDDEFSADYIVKLVFSIALSDTDIFLKPCIERR